MILLAVLLLLIGIFAAVKILFWVGVVLLVAGLVMNFGIAAPLDGPRRRYW